VRSSQPRIRVSVLGAGAWGSALAAAAATNHDVCLWARDTDLIESMSAHRRNVRYLPGLNLPISIHFTADITQAIEYGTTQSTQTPAIIILGTPVIGLRDMCDRLSQHFHVSNQIATQPKTSIIWTCKGLDPHTGQLPHEIVAQALGATVHYSLGVLSGPSFAKEVAQGLPVALTIASLDESLRALVREVFHYDPIRIYATTDIVGVEVGGALKNIIAIACGIADGLALGDNARAALITRGLAEMTRFGVKIGADAATLSGLTGLGDLVLTATGELSRNRQVGLALGKGQSLSDILASGLTAEGVRCAQAVSLRAKSLGVDMPVTDAVCQVLFHHISVKQAVSQLLTREAKSE
jgi:glycerol-3-phosphate dehydrogenase (NAD(P)+)